MQGVSTRLGERSELPGRRGLRWLATEARDVARIAPGRAAPTPAVPSASRAVARWQHRVERRRLVALARRAALAGLAAACVLELAALARGRQGIGPWLVPAAAVAIACAVLGLRARTNAATAARMLERDLALGAEVSTALELEAPGAPAARGLASLALADGRRALGESLAGARARLRPRRAEAVSLAALAAAFAVLVVVPSPWGGDSSAAGRRAAAHAPAGTPVGGAPASTGVGPTLSGFGQHTPVTSQSTVAGISPGSSGTGVGALSGHSPYGSGVATNTPEGSVEPVTRSVGTVGAKTGTQAASASGASAREGSGTTSQGSLGARAGGAAGQAQGAASEGVQGVSPVAGGQASSAQGPSATPATAGTAGGNSRGGSGSSAPGTAAGRPATSAAAGGATAGGSRGAANASTGVVPQLKPGSALPLQPGYEAVKGSRGTAGEASSASEGAGGASSHAGTATAGSVGGGKGSAYVPPGGSSVAAIDRSLILGYFGSFARVNASGW